MHHCRTNPLPKIFQWMNFFFSPSCLHVFFFRRGSSAQFFISDRTSFNIKGMQSLAQFNYSTAQGDSLFGVSIFAKFEYRGYQERNELLKVSHLMTSFPCQGNSASSCWSLQVNAKAKSVRSSKAI